MEQKIPENPDLKEKQGWPRRDEEVPVKTWGDRFPLDEELLQSWASIEGLFHQSFILVMRGKEASKKASRGTRIDNRSCGWFIAAGWLHSEDFRTIQEVKAYSDMIQKSRPHHENWMKQRNREGPFPSSPHFIEGSILTIPPAPDRKGWLPGLIKRAETTVLNLKLMAKELGSSSGKKRFLACVDPDRSQGDPRRKIPKIPIPKGIPGVFQPIAL